MRFFLIYCVIGLAMGFLPKKIARCGRNGLFLSSKKYPFSKSYYEKALRRYSDNILDQNNTRFGEDLQDDDDDRKLYEVWHSENETYSSNGGSNAQKKTIPRIHILMGRNGRKGGTTTIGLGDLPLGDFFQIGGNGGDNDDDYSKYKSKKERKTENFEVITDHATKFSDIGGYDNVKEELKQCIDMLANSTKYSRFNVRIPRGIIFEGPPGNGKTMIAKALAGEANLAFIPVSGAQFQDKYVGVGSSRVRELFQLASRNTPVIIFIDEIDALGRKRSGEGETSGSERDNTLNQLLIAMDGFKNNTGIFVVAATNRADLLDPALLRPGRIDKRIYIGNPDANTREAIIRIYTSGKPYDAKVSISDLVEMTTGFSGAQIENLINEAMINALRCNREVISKDDFEFIINKMMVGWQPNQHVFTSDIIDHIAIHELGHAVVGVLAKHHNKVSKVVINLSSPKSPAYTVFKSSEEPIYTREALFEHLMILLGGRIAEEVFYNVSVTTGAINDFSEAYKLAEKMVMDYGMGKSTIYPSKSEKYLAMIDDEIYTLINDAYQQAEVIVRKYKDVVYEFAEILKRDYTVNVDSLVRRINQV
ncbi:MAG: AAA family ATPase [Alphaproteobacteria bacterium]|nr:AAA family ATPase [Alphaproteobacteria bacterium]